MIDEIDLHLHPAWQRAVIGNLRGAFPSVQWIATTHSPQVLSEASAEWVRLLDASSVVGRVDHTQGKDTNTILEDVMDVPSRPEATKHRLDTLARAIDEGRFDDARAALVALSQELGVDDAAVVSAAWDLRFAEGGDAAD